MVDLSSSLCQRLPEGKHVSMLSQWIQFLDSGSIGSRTHCSLPKPGSMLCGNHSQDSLLSGLPQMDWLKGKFGTGKPQIELEN